MSVANFSIQQIEQSFPEFEIESIIGAGGQKQVFKVKKQNEYFALKIILLEQGVYLRFQISRIRREIETMINVESPFLVKLIDAGIKRISGNQCIFFVEQFIDGPTLYDRIDSTNLLTSQETIDVGVCILKAIDALWKENVVHRDIKPKNIILSDHCTAILIDLGVALAKLDQTITLPIHGRGPGTPIFMAPEVLSYDKDKQCERTDIFSLGITLIFAHTRLHPFENNQTGLSITQNIENGYRLNLEQLIPDNICLRGALDKMTRGKIYERPRNIEVAIATLRSCQ